MASCGARCCRCWRSWDNLISIRPFPDPDELDLDLRRPVLSRPRPPLPPNRGPNSEAREWSEDEIPNAYMLVEFKAEVDGFTRGGAIIIGDQCVPKSVLLEVESLLEGDAVDLWPVKKWFARKEGLE